MPPLSSEVASCLPPSRVRPVIGPPKIYAVEVHLVAIVEERIEMWIVTGCFDEEDKQSNATKSKLLKPGKTYNIGRKAHEDTHLVVNKSAISREHAKLVVGPHSQDDVNNPDAVPLIRYLSLSKSKAHLLRGNGIARQNIAQNETADIQQGDTLQLSSGNAKEPGVSLVFDWIPMYPLFLRLPRPQIASITQRAAPLGFKFAKRSTPEVTHLIANSVDRSSEKLYTALVLGATVVNEDWWTAICERAERPASEEGSWEYSFSGLDGTAEWPPTVEDDDLSLKQLEAQPNRKTLFHGLTFVLLGDATGTAELTAQLEFGGAHVESVDLLETETTSTSLLPKLRETQSAANARLAASARPDKNTLAGGLCLVLAKVSVRDALGKTWKKYEEMIASLDVPLVTVEQIQSAILMASCDFLPHGQPAPSLGEPAQSSAPSTKNGASSSLPDEVPPTLPEGDEPPTTQTAPPSTTQIKRRRGRTALQDLFDDDEPPPLPPPTSRARTPEVAGSSRKMAPPSTTKKRKRTVLDTVFDDTIEEMPEPEPEYKRLKREEEERESSENYQKEAERAAAVVDAVYRQYHGESVSLPSMTQEELEATRERRRTAASLLEEEEAAAAKHPPVTSSRKRKANEALDDHVDEEVSPPAKRPARQNGASHARRAVSPPISTRTVEQTNSPAPSANDGAGTTSRDDVVAETSPTSQRRREAGEDVPMDTDPQFLQALASRKRGKRKEDESDRDFNALRISAPVNGHAPVQDAADEYRLLDDLDFGGPAPVGNFMRIVLTKEVFRKDKDVNNPSPAHSRAASETNENATWNGQKPWDDPKWANRPNYKAFVKNKKRPAERQPVPLTLPPVEDYGMGNAYWKGDKAGAEPARPISKPPTATTAAAPTQNLDEDFGSLNISSGRTSRAAPPVGRTASAMRPVDEDVEMDDFDASTSRQPSPGARSRFDQPAAASTSRTATKRSLRAIDEDDDEDDEIRVIQPSRSSTRSARATPAPAPPARSTGRKRATATDDEASLAGTDDPPSSSRIRTLRSTGEAGSTVGSSGRAAVVTQQQQQRKRTRAAVAADDSDDDIRVRRKRK